jgi:dihydrofolate reductase
MDRSLVLFIATSLDGYIAKPNDDIDWLFTDADYGITPFLERIDTIVMGRKSYEVLARFAPWPYAGKRCHVMTGRPDDFDDDRVTFTSEKPSRLLARLREEPGKDIWLLGGGETVRGFVDTGLVDEMIVSIHPIILGGGAPLIPAGTKETGLTLVDVIRYDSGLVTLTYEVV